MSQAGMLPPVQVVRAVEAARILGLAVATLARWRVHGYGPPFRKFGRAVVYSLADLQTWSDAQERRSTSDRGAQAVVRD